MHTHAYAHDIEHRRRPAAEGERADGGQGEDLPGPAGSGGPDRSREREAVGRSGGHGEEAQVAFAASHECGVILADTSIWVDHLRSGSAKLSALLETSQVV